MNKLVCRCVYLLAGEISVHTVNGSDALLSQDALHQKIHAFKIPKGLIIMEQFLCYTNKQKHAPYLSYFVQNNIKRFLIHVCTRIILLFVTRFTVQRN